ncbi:MAG: hypothetical protein BAA01_01175 [Bacillus thermozeamaize]|uniref:GGDEF domain-containing protein n=1 Tax=Bacillus thermozeamaize TaxID=230954 RepID=A0A1Y3PF69_9BACI|nr:MAG: hypothetical protein BAA01_01175 [Bacillus thermozeamaize]
MKAIRWTDWMFHPVSEQPESYAPDPNDLVWQDPVTETIFFMPEEEYDGLLRQLEEKLATMSAEERFWHVWHQDTIPFGTREPLQLAPHMPYPKPLYARHWHNATKSERMRTRLSDHVLIRTGLYYALYHPNKENWPALRKQLLQIHSPIAQPIDQFLSTGQWIGEPQQLSIVKAGAVKIKQYFMETSHLQEVRGASLLLDELNRKRILRLLAEYWTPEILVYSGGGNFLILCPEAEGPLCAGKIEELFKTVTIHAKCVAHTETFSIRDLAMDRFQDNLSWLEMRKHELQMLKLPPTDDISPDINAYRSKQMDISFKIDHLNDADRHRLAAHADSFLRTSDKPLCQQCRQRIADVQIDPYQDEPRLCCNTCLHKIIAGKNRSVFVEEMKDLFQRLGKPFADMALAETLEDIIKSQRERYGKDELAVIYGDGNNMGAVVEQIRSFQVYRYFSHLTASITKYALYTTLQELILENHQHDKAPFEIIAVGGDDLFFIVPGLYGLETAKRLGRKFDAGFRKYPASGDDEEKLTLSVGICFAPYKIPLTVLFSTAEELLKSAKQHKKQSRVRGGTLDFMKLESNSPFSQNVQTYRQLNHVRTVRTSTGKQFTLHHLFRPYSWDETDAMQTFIRKLKNIDTARQLAFRLRDSVIQMSTKEANLYYLVHFCTARFDDKQDEDRHCVHECYRAFLDAPWTKEKNIKEKYFPYIIIQDENQEHLYTPWHDVMELWDMEEEELWQESLPSNGT